jgi:hypothetical protein
LNIVSILLYEEGISKVSSLTHHHFSTNRSFTKNQASGLPSRICHRIVMKNTDGWDNNGYMKSRLPILFWLVVTACVGVTFPAMDTPQTALPTLEQLPTIPPAPVSPMLTSPFNYKEIEIRGSTEFITQTIAALALLEEKDTEAFIKIQTYVGIIEQGEHSGMWAWEVPPRYEVGDATAFFSVTWYASTIAHDATHSELYAQYQAAHPGEIVPDDAYGGVEVERFCIGYQLDVAKRIGAPQSEIDYLSSLDGTHCDLDNDGDCDWEDYENRDW